MDRPVKSSQGLLIRTVFSRTARTIQLTHQKQTTVGRDARALEINLQRGVERELKRLILCFTHWIEASTKSELRSKPHEYWRCLDHKVTYAIFKREMWANSCRALGSNR
jgi:hypothetical protein